MNSINYLKDRGVQGGIAKVLHLRKIFGKYPSLSGKAGPPFEFLGFFLEFFPENFGIFGEFSVFIMINNWI